MFKDKGHDTHTTQMTHIYTGNPLMTVHFEEGNMNKYRIPNNIYLKYFCFVLRYIKKDIKDKYVYSLYNKNYGNTSLHYTAFLFYFRGFPVIPCYYRLYIKGYPTLGRIKIRLVAMKGLN